MASPRFYLALCAETVTLSVCSFEVFSCIFLMKDSFSRQQKRKPKWHGLAVGLTVRQIVSIAKRRPFSVQVVRRQNSMSCARVIGQSQEHSPLVVQRPLCHLRSKSSCASPSRLSRLAVKDTPSADSGSTGTYVKSLPACKTSYLGFPIGSPFIWGITCGGIGTSLCTTLHCRPYLALNCASLSLRLVSQDELGLTVWQMAEIEQKTSSEAIYIIDCKILETQNVFQKRAVYRTSDKTRGGDCSEDGSSTLATETYEKNKKITRKQILTCTFFSMAVTLLCQLSKNMAGVTFLGGVILCFRLITIYITLTYHVMHWSSCMLGPSCPMFPSQDADMLCDGHSCLIELAFEIAALLTLFSHCSLAMLLFFLTNASLSHLWILCLASTTLSEFILQHSLSTAEPTVQLHHPSCWGGWRLKSFDPGSSILLFLSSSWGP